MQSRKKTRRTTGFVQSQDDAAVSSVPRLSNTGHYIQTKTTVLPDDEVAPPLPFLNQEDLLSASVADSVDHFSYLLGCPPLEEVKDSDVENDDDDGIKVVSKARNQNTDNPMATWRSFKDQYLSEFLRRDGLGDDSEICARCTSETPDRGEYRCCDEECVGLGLVCRKCCLEFHETHPLHCIEKWNGFYYESASLHALGLTVQLGHPAGIRCPFPHSTTTEFTVLNTNGIHNVHLLFCGCSTAPPAFVQLLRRAWYPATPVEPRSATTFSLLRLFHTINTLGKLPAWEMWQALRTMTENRSGTPPQNRYKVLLRTVRQWRFLKLLKRAGRGHDPTGVDGTSPGELALRCPACPHVGINLPDDWRSQPRQYRFRLFTAQDANFRLRNGIVSTPERDPPLGDGLTHFTTQSPYEAHIRTFVNQEDMSSCSGFQAMFLANLKNVRGLRTTGVAEVTCGRHGVWMPNGMGDLQRGERYCNIDPLIAGVLKANEELEVVISYDIACQWGSGFWNRAAQLPDEWRPSMERNRVTFCIPKFHLWAHKVECHALYSFNYLPGAGRTHAETPEENWADSNRAAPQTKMMGPGSRHDTLDDIFAAHNFRTILAFGRVFTKRLAEAIKEAKVHAQEFDQFTAGIIPYVGQETVDTWLAAVLAWDSNRRLPCPYEPHVQGKDTLGDVELQLIREEKQRLSEAGSITHESSMTVFLTTGIDIERLQRALAWEVAARRSGATYQEINIERQRATIIRMIRRFRGLQQVFMPKINEFLTPEQLVHITDPSSILPEATKLFFPSELRDADRKLSRACATGLVDGETRLREAECRDALEALRQGLRTRSAGHQFIVRNVTGQNPTTRAEGVQKKIQVSIQLNKLRYRWARNALFRLRKHGDWEEELRVLEERDIRGMNERLLTSEEEAEREHLHSLGLVDEFIAEPSSSDAVVAPGEGRRRLSWIWYSYPIPVDGLDVLERNSSPVIREAIKIEWCKARARKLRWEEEVDLMVEEMRRVVQYRRWRAGWWRERVALRSNNVPPVLAQGLAGYALSQASREDGIASDLEMRWRDLREIGEAFLSGTVPSRSVEVDLDDDEYEDEENRHLDDIE